MSRARFTPLVVAVALLASLGEPARANAPLVVLHDFGGGGFHDVDATTSMAQSVEPTTAVMLDLVELGLEDVGGGTDGVRVRLVAMPGAVPGSAPTDVLGSFDVPHADIVAAGIDGLVAVDVSSAGVLVGPGHRIAIVVEPLGPSTEVSWRGANKGDVEAGTCFQRDLPSGTWNDMAQDLRVRLTGRRTGDALFPVAGPATAAGGQTLIAETTTPIGGLYVAESTILGQTCPSPVHAELRRCDVLVSSDSTPGEFRVQVVAVQGGMPSLDPADVFAEAHLSTAGMEHGVPQFVSVHLPHGVQVAPGEAVAIVVRANGPMASLECHAASDPDPPGSTLFERSVGSGWSAAPNDLVYRLWGTVSTDARLREVQELLVDRLDVDVSSRASQTSLDDAHSKLDVLLAAPLVDAASQGSVDLVNAKLDAGLDAPVSTRATQSSVDAVHGKLDARLDAAVSSRATQASVDTVGTKLDVGLDAAVSSRATQVSLDDAHAKLDVLMAVPPVDAASQASVDAVNAKLDASLDAPVSSRATQASVDGVHGKLDASLDAPVSSRATQASVDAANTKLDAGLDAPVSSRATQASVDTVGDDVLTVDEKIDLRLDVLVSSRATQASLDAMAGVVSSQLDATVSSRASQASADDLAAALADHDAEVVSLLDALLASTAGTSRFEIERALLAGDAPPLFFTPAGPTSDPAGLPGSACPLLPAAGAPAVDGDGLFEHVRCAAWRAIENATALGYDVRVAQRWFDDAEAELGSASPDWRRAVDYHAKAVQALTQGGGH